MTEQEARVRAELADLAERVPASADPWAEHGRRRAAGRRRLALAGTVTACVATVGVVWGITGADQATPTGPAAPVTTSSTAHRLPDRVEATRFTEGGTPWTVWVLRSPHGFCLAVVPEGRPPDGPDQHAGSPDCAGQDTTLTSVTSRAILSGDALGGGPLPGTLVFTTEPAVASMTVRDGMGHEVPVRRASEADTGFGVFVATFPTGTQGFGYTARNAAGEVVEEAIT